jgi:hypothetical protein
MMSYGVIPISRQYIIRQIDYLVSANIRCSVPQSPCNIMDQAVDSFASYFQIPGSATNTLDTIERILSIPMLGTAFIAIRRKFERIK